MSKTIYPSEPTIQRPTGFSNATPSTGTTKKCDISTPVINEAFMNDFYSVKENYADYLKSMINSLLENQMNLSSALDETREMCDQLHLQKSELEATNTHEMHILQTEISLCRRRESDVLLAYDELRHRVESIDHIIEQIPWLDTLFNSSDPLPARLKAMKGDELLKEVVSSCTLAFDDATPHLSPAHNSFSSWADIHPSTKAKPGCDSPLSDSGCTSESHDELSLASLTSANSSPFLRQIIGDNRCTSPAHYIEESEIPVGLCRRSKSTVFGLEEEDKNRGGRLKRQMTSATTPTNQVNTERPTSTFGRITDSLKKSITKFADKSEWKMEALVARQREATTMILLNETQAEVRKIEARCCGLKRQQDQQEARISVKENEIDRLINTERQLRRELRNWQQRVFQLESETQEVKRNSQITELEMKSRLLESEMHMSQVEQTLQQSAAYNDIFRLLNSNLAATPSTCRRNSSDSFNSPLEDTSKPPRSRALKSSNSLKVSQRPYFASVTGLNMINSPQHVRDRNNLSRPLSSLQLNDQTVLESSLENASFHTKSFGSLSELQLKVDV